MPTPPRIFPRCKHSRATSRFPGRRGARRPEPRPPAMAPVAPAVVPAVSPGAETSNGRWCEDPAGCVARAGPARWAGHYRHLVVGSAVGRAQGLGSGGLVVGPLCETCRIVSPFSGTTQPGRSHRAGAGGRRRTLMSQHPGQPGAHGAPLGQIAQHPIGGVIAKRYRGKCPVARHAAVAEPVFRRPS